MYINLYVCVCMYVYICAYMQAHAFPTCTHGTCVTICLYARTHACIYLTRMHADASEKYAQKCPAAAKIEKKRQFWFCVA